MEGSLIYRYTYNQIEIEGLWGFSEVAEKSRFSYLLRPEREVVGINLEISEENAWENDGFCKEKDEGDDECNNEDLVPDEHDDEESRSIIDINDNNNNINRDEFNNKEIVIQNKEGMVDVKSTENILYLCPATVHEILLLPNIHIFKSVLSYMSGFFSGFFIYFNKTIEDKFKLSFTLEENQVRVSGEGTNNLGDFNIIGYANFFTIKEQLIMSNDISSNVIKFGTIRVTRIYSNFDPNENSRVIKSFQHSRKRVIEEFGY